jgi:uncharacterized protein (DUF1800 family)
MSIDFTPISSWTAADVMHFARRAGFGVTPEQAATLAAQSPSTVIDGWVDGAVAIVGDSTTFNTVLGARADVVNSDAADAQNGGTAQAFVAGPHPFYVQGPGSWRSQFREGEAQAYLAFRMQYNPYAMSERLTLFFHNLFATGISKVESNPLMLNQMDLFRTQGFGRFEDTVVAVSKDPAMCIWLDSVSNNATYSSVPNENYGREVMELYSLGVDNGYNQTDITNLARALSGWSYTIPPSGWIVNPANPSQTLIADGVFSVYQGQNLPTNHRIWWGGSGTETKTYLMHPTSASNSQSKSTNITYLGATFDIVATAGSQVPGENALRGIFVANPAGRRTNSAEFLAKRLLLHFVTPNYTQSDYQSLATQLDGADFNLATVLKALFKSTYFFAADKRYALVEGPVSWAVRTARMLCPDLAIADGVLPAGMPSNAGKAFPAWRAVVGDPYNPDTFDNMGMKLLDPRGPNGWHEHTAWINSNTMRYRGRYAAALALNEAYTNYYYAGSNSYQPQPLTLFPNRPHDWFPSAPGTALGAYTRLIALLQPAPIPTVVRDAWLTGLFGGGGTAVDTSLAADQTKLRELAFLILCSPAAQLY